MFADRTRQGTVLLLLGVVVLLQQAHVAARATCKLHLEGFGSSRGIKSAQLSCSGGTVTASAHPVLLANFTRSFSGVQWSGYGNCGNFTSDCLLTICGDTSASFTAALVRNVNVSQTADMLVCLAGSSNLVFEAAQFQGNAGRPITVLSPDVKLHLKGSNFTDNKLLWKSLAGGAVWLGGGTAVVESSIFIGNAVLTDGGAIGVGANVSSFNMSSTVFTGNNGESACSAAQFSLARHPL